jgi:hypothetical protein
MAAAGPSARLARYQSIPSAVYSMDTGREATMSSAIGALIGIIFVLIIMGVVWWAIQQLLPLIPLGEPFATIIRILMVVILVLVVLWIIIVLLGVAGVHVGAPFFR